MQGVTQSAGQLAQNVVDSVVQLGDTQMRLIWTAAILTLLLLSRAVVLRIVRRRTDDLRTRYIWRKTVTYIVGLLALFLIGRLWFEGFRSVATFFGLLGAGIAVALKDPVTNLAGWLFILWRRPFRVGDRIEIAGTAGDVIDQRLFQFTLLEIGNWVDAEQSTGRIVHVPNGKVFADPLANYSGGFPYIWNEVPVLITFESNWEKARTILHEIAVQHASRLTEQAERDVLAASRQFLIFYSTLKPTVYLTVKDSGVMLTVRHLCGVRERRNMTQVIWEDVLRAFALHDDIDMAYPTTRYYDNVREGKPGARAEPPA